MENELITVRTYTYEHEAYMAKVYLEEYKSQNNDTADNSEKIFGIIGMFHFIKKGIKSKIT
ncbi:MAG: hypothetical protein DRI44_10280 [Chlamydiae bacterium]|nr:MAG: hypothetical protein DRI44_10280 [Chlamydiota bacterium]